MLSRTRSSDSLNTKKKPPSIKPTTAAEPVTQTGGRGARQRDEERCKRQEKGRLKKHVITSLCRRLATSKKPFPQNENYMF